MPRRNRAHLSLVIPTRNEADNVERVITSICSVLPGDDKELIFVDDSDDDTPATLQRLLNQADCPGLVLQRANGHRAGGLSTAVCRGFATSSGDYVCTMDADLQHPASAVPMLLEAVEQTGADIVVGSRYLDGGGVAGFDGRSRKLISNLARAAAHRTLPCSRVTSDPLSGFFLVNRRVFEGVELRPVGYKILLEIIVRGRWKSLADVPYAFHSRNAGMSKATLREGLRFVRHLALLGPQAWTMPRPASAAVRQAVFPTGVSQPSNGRSHNGHPPVAPNGHSPNGHHSIPFTRNGHSNADTTQGVRGLVGLGRRPRGPS